MIEGMSASYVPETLDPFQKCSICIVLDFELSKGMCWIVLDQGGVKKPRVEGVRHSLKPGIQTFQFMHTQLHTHCTINIYSIITAPTSCCISLSKLKIPHLNCDFLNSPSFWKLVSSWFLLDLFPQFLLLKCPGLDQNKLDRSEFGLLSQQTGWLIWNWALWNLTELCQRVSHFLNESGAVARQKGYWEMSMIGVAILKFENHEEYPEVVHLERCSADPKKQSSTASNLSSYHNWHPFVISP